MTRIKQTPLFKTAVLMTLWGACIYLNLAPVAFALPQGASVQEGTVTVESDAGTMNINQSTDKAIIHYDSFNIANGETVNFIQPSSSAVALNRIFDSNPSQIAGALNANGRIILINQNGIVFSGTSQIDVNAIIASSLDITDANFLANNYRFYSPALNPAAIINQGIIQTKEGLDGYIALLGGVVENQEGALIQVYQGTVNLASGKAVTLSLDSGNNLVSVAIPEGVAQQVLDSEGGSYNSAILNEGTIEVGAGGVVRISQNAASNLFTYGVNNKGIISAGSAEEEGSGQIVIRAADAIELSGDDSSGTYSTYELDSELTDRLPLSNIITALDDGVIRITDLLGYGHTHNDSVTDIIWYTTIDGTHYEIRHQIKIGDSGLFFAIVKNEVSALPENISTSGPIDASDGQNTYYFDLDENGILYFNLNGQRVLTASPDGNSFTYDLAPYGIGEVIINVGLNEDGTSSAIMNMATGLEVGTAVVIPFELTVSQGTGAFSSDPFEQMSAMFASMSHHVSQIGNDAVEFKIEITSGGMTLAYTLYRVVEGILKKIEYKIPLGEEGGDDPSVILITSTDIAQLPDYNFASGAVTIDLGEMVFVLDIDQDGSFVVADSEDPGYQSSLLRTDPASHTTAYFTMGGPIIRSELQEGGNILTQIIDSSTQEILSWSIIDQNFNILEQGLGAPPQPEPEPEPSSPSMDIRNIVANGLILIFTAMDKINPGMMKNYGPQPMMGSGYFYGPLMGSDFFSQPVGGDFYGLNVDFGYDIYGFPIGGYPYGLQSNFGLRRGQEGSFTQTPGEFGHQTETTDDQNGDSQERSQESEQEN